MARGEYGRAIALLLLRVAVVAAVFAPLLEPASRDAVWFNALALAACAGLERIAAWWWPGRPISLSRTFIVLGAINFLILVLVFFSEGDVEYANPTGRFSHAQDAWKTALAGVLFMAAVLVGAAVGGRWPRAARKAPFEGAAGFSSIFLVLCAVLAMGHCAIRLVVLFLPRELPDVVGYAFRLYLGLLLVLFYFVGIGLFRRLVSARLAAGLLGITSLVVLLAGSRSDALYPLVMLAVGFVVASAPSRAKLLRMGVLALPLFFLAMFVGGLVREDERGRTGEAALARVDELGETVRGSSSYAKVVDSTLRRMVSHSTHSVITRIPREIPFESDGLVKLPQEFVDRVLPQFALTGVTPDSTPRHWILNGLGFLVNWSTSVEFTMVADAWYRGGFAGVLVVGLLFGAVLQLLENLIYRLLLARPAFSTIFIGCLSGMLAVPGRDVVWGIRSLLYLAVASGGLVALAILLEARRQLGGARLASRVGRSEGPHRQGPHRPGALGA